MTFSLAVISTEIHRPAFRLRAVAVTAVVAALAATENVTSRVPYALGHCDPNEGEVGAQHLSAHAITDSDKMKTTSARHHGKLPHSKGVPGADISDEVTRARWTRENTAAVARLPWIRLRKC